MKFAALLLALLATSAFADNYVRGYTKSDGTYVAPHYRSEQNSNRSDNYSSQGNTNPYTGQRGSQRNENSDPPAYNKNHGNYGYNNPYDTDSSSGGSRSRR